MGERSEEGAEDFKFLFFLREKNNDFFQGLNRIVALFTFFSYVQR